MTESTCKWCDTVNSFVLIYCGVCGHEAHEWPVWCQCEACLALEAKSPRVAQHLQVARELLEFLK